MPCVALRSAGASVLQARPVDRPGEHRTHHYQQPVLPDRLGRAVPLVSLKCCPGKQVNRHIDTNSNCITHCSPTDTLRPLRWLEGCKEICHVWYRSREKHGKSDPEEILHN